MISVLKGVVFDVGGDHIILEVNSIGYKVFCAQKVIYSSSIGDSLTLFTEMIIRENDIRMHGFLTKEDRDFFNHLLGIQGVGGKLAQTIINEVELNDVLNAISLNTPSVFTKISGVGPKLGARLLSELKNKPFIKNHSVQNNMINNNDSGNSVLLDAISALKNLGYQEDKVISVLQKMHTTHPEISLEELIKEGLKKLS